MKTIKIKYVDVFPGFDQETYYLTKCLRKQFNVAFSEDPDYILYSCFGHEHLKYTDCIKICFLGENIAPDFNLCDYAIAQEKLTFGDRYFWRPTSIDLAAFPELYNRVHRTGLNENRNEFCSFVYSNGDADPFREQLFQAINQYKPILCGGKLHHNFDLPHIEGNDFRTDRISYEKQFKFSIACENSSHPGYCTEKILISFIAGTIPIYWGDPCIKELYNAKAFINVADYPSLDAVVDAIKKVDTTPELYEEMIRQPVFVNGWNYEAYEKSFDGFLNHIFSQPKGKAYRRNRVLWGDRYDQTLNEWYSAWKEKQTRSNWKFWKKVLH